MYPARTVEEYKTAAVGEGGEAGRGLLRERVGWFRYVIYIYTPSVNLLFFIPERFGD